MAMLAEVRSTTFGKRYFLHDLLGEGGMGAVYKATDRLTGDTVALKRVTMPAERLAFNSRSESSDPYLALAWEFQMLASLRHPHIIEVLDYGFDGKRQPYFTMTLLEKPQNIVKAGRGQPLEVQINLLVQMLQALAYLHRRGIVHRDLKPGNVFVVNNHVKVLDFGLSISAGTTGDTGGTMTYMAPEVLQGKPTSQAADLYAVGIMAYELLVGRYPYDASTIDTLLDDILYKMPVVPMIGPHGLVSFVVERLLDKEPEARYSDPQEVIEALSEAKFPASGSICGARNRIYAVNVGFYQGGRWYRRRTSDRGRKWRWQIAPCPGDQNTLTGCRGAGASRAGDQRRR
jgi:eukaryotic-like serine/threonine-protein kinase